MEYKESYQVSLRGHTDKDQVVTHPDLLTFWPLFRCRMNGPPTCLTCRNRSKQLPKFSHRDTQPIFQPYTNTNDKKSLYYNQQSMCVLYKSLALPVESSCKPTSKASLSVSERDVVKQLRYWGRKFSFRMGPESCLKVKTTSFGSINQTGKSQSYHAWVVMSQKDCMTIQQGTMTSTLRRLERQKTETILNVPEYDRV